MSNISQITVYQKLLLTYFSVACLHFYFIPWRSGFSPPCIIHTCVCACAQNLSCFYADRSGVKKECCLSSDIFQTSDCTSSSLKQPFTGVSLDRQFILNALHYEYTKYANCDHFITLSVTL